MACIISDTATAMISVVCLGASFAFPSTATAQSAGKTASDEVLVSVDGTPITAGDLEFAMLSRRVPQEQQAALRKRFLEQLVDKRLMQAFLKGRKVHAKQSALDAQVTRIKQLIQKNGEDPQKILASFGYTDETLRNELALPLAWQQYVRTLVTQKQLREYWDLHHEDFDGTQIRAAHILLKLPNNADATTVQAAEEKLRQIRADIVAGKTGFAEAAAKHSEAPTADRGGDLGYFPYRGKMPVEYSQAAFPLKEGEVSEPFRTRYGMHLITVSGRKPGQLSLEDVREQVLEQRGQELWDELVAQERARAKIEWKTPAE